MPDTMTVRHIGFDTPILINAADFDPAVHSEWADEPKAKAPAKKAAKGEKGE